MLTDTNFHPPAASIPRESSPALAVQGVSMAFGEGDSARTVIDSLDFDVAPGQFLCVVGASGCGKTTLLRLLAGLTNPTEGSVTFMSQRIEGPSRERAIVFQDYGRALLPWRTVHGNISLALENMPLTKLQRHDRVVELAGKMGLSHAIDRYPDQLSGGMQQRVQIARCLAQDPKLLLMDEPFGALDAITRQNLQDEVRRLAREHRTTVVFITHDLEEAIYLGDRVIVLAANPGRIAADIAVPIPQPRNQLTTRENPIFLELRHQLYALLEET